MADALLSSGMIVGETWEIVAPIGRGGMGEVWLAKHVRVEGKKAAIKVLRSTTDGMRDQIARFRREAEIAARLEHPNIVQLLDFSSLPSGAPYLVMELLRGESLGKRLEQGPMPLEELQEVMVAVGSALHVAHGAGVVHRDLKPENIFLVATATGTVVKVLDFGISKLVDSDSVMTSDSIVLGTPQYMSPEQAMAEHQTITGQSDLFSLGTICFEALTGHRPFAAPTLARTVYLVALEPSPSLRTYGRELPEHVVQAVDHALAKQPADRTSDAATFVKELCGVSISPSGAQTLPRPQPKVEPRAPRDPNAETISGRAAAPLAPQKKRSALPLVGLAAALGVGAMMRVLADGTPEQLPPIAVLALAAVADAGPAVVEAEVKVAAPLVPVDAGPPVRHLTLKAQPLSLEQQELLDNARAAASRSDWNQVIEWTLKPAVAERSDAITLRVLAWCHQGNLSLVNAYKGKIAPAEHGTVASACRAQGIDL